MKKSPEQFGQEKEEIIENVESKEKERISKIIVIDDNYAEELSNIFEKKHENDENKPEILQSTDYETALKQIRSIQDTRGVRILTDMYMPEKKGSFDPTEGLKVFGEIFEFYGIAPNVAKKKINKVKQILAEYRDNIEKVSYESGSQKEYSYRGECIARDIREIFEKDPNLDNFLKTAIAKTNMMMNLYSDYSRNKKWGAPFFSDDLKKLSEEELIEKGILTKTGNRLHISDDYIKNAGGEQKEYLEERMITGKEFITQMSYALLWGNDGGLPMGVRLAEEAHKKNIPFVIVSGWHGGPGEANSVYAQYLFEKGITDNPNVLNDVSDSDFQDVIGQYSYFLTSKYTTSEDTARNEKNENNLKIIAKVLESR